jgi:hypothetical protein
MDSVKQSVVNAFQAEHQLPLNGMGREFNQCRSIGNGRQGNDASELAQEDKD